MRLTKIVFLTLAATLFSSSQACPKKNTAINGASSLKYDVMKPFCGSSDELAATMALKEGWVWHETFHFVGNDFLKIKSYTESIIKKAGYRLIKHEDSDWYYSIDRYRSSNGKIIRATIFQQLDSDNRVVFTGVGFVGK